MQDNLNTDEIEEIETLDDALIELDRLKARIAELEGENEEVIWPLVIPLDPPVQFGQKAAPISELRLREPRLGDLQNIPVNPENWTFDHLLKVGQKLTTVGEGTTCISMRALIKLPPKSGRIITKAVRIFLLECLV